MSHYATVELKCLECMHIFTTSEEVYRTQNKVYCPKCGGTDNSRTQGPTRDESW